jgi:excinuclease ABC subunit B
LTSNFRVDAPFKPAGDQPEAIEQLVEGVRAGLSQQVLLGVTGSGKTNVMAWAVEQLQRPVLVLSPNKTLAAQLCAEFRRLLPDNAVEYFVSYYDYYQPEAYIARSDTYIEKDSSRNDEIDRMRHSTTQTLMTRRDVLVVASISCIYGIGSVEDYMGESLHIEKGQSIRREVFLRKLTSTSCPPTKRRFCESSSSETRSSGSRSWMRRRARFSALATSSPSFRHRTM